MEHARRRLRVYHFLNRKYGLQDIRRRRLKVSTINELNDPFELIGIASKDRDVRQAYADTKAGLAKYGGLLCFSGNWRNPVQWSHYADRHRGLCLGFDVTAQLTPVTYASKRLKPDLAAMKTGGAPAQAHMLRMLTTKFSHWRYENEHRLFVRLKSKDKKTGFYFFRFSKRVALREVIVGPNSTITGAELGRTLGNMATNVEVYKARLAFRTFRVVRQRSGKLWK
jgi:hypothetical protein